MISEREILAEAYQTADFYVFPSRQEGLGNVVLEAMSCSLPVISSDLPVLKGVILPGENGIVFSVGDEVQLADGIKALLHEEDYSRSLGEKAREYILENHYYDNWQEKIAKLYQDLSA